jgi:macrolide transport system ATP-binding/permease protein
MPDWREHLRTRLAPLRLTPTREAEIVDELSQHLDDRYEQLRAEGSGEDEATRLALEELQDDDALAGRMRPLRQARTAVAIAEGEPRRRPLLDVAQDLRYAARMLAKQPAFTLAAVVTLALGIGANTAVFSLVNATLFQRLPVADPERLVYMYRGTSGVFAYPQYAALRDRTTALDGLAGWGGIAVSLNAGDSAELVPGVIATGNFFQVLGVQPALGRLLTPADDVTPGAHPVAVIAHEFWQTRFGGRADTVGREIRLNGHVFTIVGIAPAGFPGPQLGSKRDIYVPMMMQAIVRPPRARYSGEQNPDLLRHNTNSWIFGIGRLKAGATADRAKAELDAALAEFFSTRVQLPPGATPPRVTLVRIEDPNAGPRPVLRSAALLVSGAVGAVLLIACANIANLLLSRAAGRRRELAVRLALGASRGRLLQQLLTESVLLSLIGGVAGVTLAWAILRAFSAAPPPAGALPLPLTFGMDTRVLLFAFVVSSATGILCGVVPALIASRPMMGQALRGAGGSGNDGGRRFDLKKLFVVAEVALSLLLLVAAGLFVRSLQSARSIDPGLDVDKLVSTPLSINLLRYTRAQGRAFYQQVVERAQSLAGVESASVARVAVLGGGGRVLSFHVEGRGGSHDHVMSEGGGVTANDLTVTNANVVGPRFFETVGIRLLNGRDFGASDIETSVPVMVLNAAAARLHFPDANPIGQRVSVDGPAGPWREIVGVVRDSAYGTIADGGVPVVYLPLSQNHETGMTLYVRSSVSPGSLAGPLRREIQRLEPNLPVPEIETMTETVGTSLYAARMGAWLLSALGGLALLLAVVGIYGVLSFSVARRTREMGIRLALGAGTRQVFLLVVRDGMWLVGVGVAIGLGAAFMGARSVGAFLYGISPTDVPSFAGAILVLAAVALVACAIPARRAIRVNPITTLRQE